MTLTDETAMPSGPAAEMPLLVVQDLHVTFPIVGGASVKAVRGLSYTLRRGE